MDLIIVDMLPYNLVEGEAFQRLHLNDPDTTFRYRKKSEKYFRTTLMPETYEKVKGKVILLLQKAEWVSFTTDIWSNPAKTCSLLSCTAHFINGSKREKVILAASVLEEDHTGQHISAKLNEIIAEFNLTNKVHMVIRDNAYNMQAAMRCGNFLSIGCVAHTLQLVIHDVIFKDATSMNLIKKCRKVVGHFKRSEQASRYLERFLETCSLPRHVLIQDIETRWNSTYLMLERLLEQKNAINLYMAERGGIEIPTAEEWEQIGYYIAILRCFYQATLDISSDSSSISLIIPLIVMLNSKMTTKDEDPEKVTLLKIQLRDSIHRRIVLI
ncbi:zinc finger BED domain-containing protein 4-like [Ostrinia furnacalis]|uniref:zinc finger BED domain-containing protein 4-like n=1 Tax=Ostrinia furnacalis TaxID=93504 RepID=UPI001038BFD8|nr:zinc finger BED domain-containing protein 4-like [Ostrinia furnacalis]